MKYDQIIDEVIAPRILTLRIVVSALLVGCVSFLAVILIIVKKFSLDQMDLAWIGLMFAVGTLAAAVLVNRVFRQKAMDDAIQRYTNNLFETDARMRQFVEFLFERFYTATILACATIEGGAFTNLIFALLRENLASLILGLIMTLFLCAFFPVRRNIHVPIADTIWQIEKNYIKR